jgi:predicted P-loop ATPase
MTTFKSVTDYLASLVWDGTPRLERWLSVYAGAEDSLYVRKVSREMLVAAVRRARHPGCRLDQLPILEGPQGCGKSSALLVLAVEDAWFTDAFVPDSRGLMEATAGKWILEMRLDEWGCDVREFKERLFHQWDEVRRAYEHKGVRVTRQFVIIGTTNETAVYLRWTVGDQRFWPVRVQRFDLEKLRADRDQLWAEAAIEEQLETGRLTEEQACRRHPRLLHNSITEEQLDCIGATVDKWVVEASELKGVDHGNLAALRAVLKAALSRAMEATP